MSIIDRPGLPAPGRRRRRQRWVGLGAAGALATTALVTAAAPASAEPDTITDAAWQWDISAELQGSAFFGGCNYLSAGASDGTEATYQASAGDVTVIKDGGEPTWATKCDLTGGSVNQQVIWRGGSGTVDPATGEVNLEFSGALSLNFYGGMVPFTIEDPVLTVDDTGNGSVVATMSGYGSSMDNPDEKFPLDPVEEVVVADLSGVVSDNDSGFTVVPDYEGVEYHAPSGNTPQNRVNEGWGSWPVSFVEFQEQTGLTSHWYTSGGALDAQKPPTAITVSYDGSGIGDPGGPGGPGEPGEPQPGDGEQAIEVTVPDPGDGGGGDPGEPGDGEFLWSIQADDATVALGEAADQGAYLQATGDIHPILVTDTREGGPEWSVSGQVGDFGGDLSARYLGWGPAVLESGAGAVAGDEVASGISGGEGLSQPSLLAASPGGHDVGSALLGADLDLRLPVDTEPGTYTAILTITALS